MSGQLRPKEGRTLPVARRSLTGRPSPVAVTLESVWFKEPPSLSSVGEKTPLWVFC